MIEVEHLSKVYGHTAAIEDVTFSVQSGDILGFLGPNGAGKTTTMRILSGYLPATKGTAKINGVDIHEDSLTARRQIGYLPESPPLYVDMTVEKFLKFVAEIKGVPRQNREKCVEDTLERCNLSDRRRDLIRKLSKGYRQRVGIAQAIVHDPPVIILDEPTIGLDPKQIIDVRNLIKDLAGDHTVILSTHILSEVSMICNQVAIINQGKIVAIGSPDILTQQVDQQTRYAITTSGTFEAVQQVLSRIPAVSRVVLDRQNEDDLDRISCFVLSSAVSDISQDLAAAIVQEGLGLYEIRRSQTTLEEVFLDITATLDSAPCVPKMPESVSSNEVNH